MLLPGASSSAISHHYDVPAEFYLSWLGDSCIYSCPIWATTDHDTDLEFAQSRKTLWYRDELRQARA